MSRLPEYITDREPFSDNTAWRVDFNVRLSSLEPLIAGTRRLVDFALSSLCSRPPRFIFASSISVLRSKCRVIALWVQIADAFFLDYPGKLAAEGPITDPKVAAGSGYSESKWVAEQVLRRAAEATSFRPVIVRIGQLSGGRNGCWNPSEWFPIIVRSGETMRCLPRSAGVCHPLFLLQSKVRALIAARCRWYLGYQCILRHRR
jgi:thioester reductase-like protein